jgi:hypothetical protein
MRKLDWKQDGSDLMEEVEIYYKKAMNTHRWGRKTYRPDMQYAFKSTTSDDEWNNMEKEKNEPRTCEDEIKALTAKLRIIQQLTCQDGVDQMKTVWIRSMHGRRYHPRMVTHQLRRYM